MLATEATFLDHIQRLPPLPLVAQRILAVTAATNASAQDVARILSQDPTIAARVLRVANSPFYGVSREITQVSRAVVLLGARAVRSLVVAICARQALGETGAISPEHTTAWNHAIAAAAACELIAKQIGFDPSEEALVAGLLHDTGQLAMVGFKPELVRHVLRDRPNDQMRLQREREHFGLDHAEAGFRILSNWNLPESLCQVARCHHRRVPRIGSETQRLTGMVVLANYFAHLMGLGFDVPLSDAQQLGAVAGQLQLSEAVQARVLATLERRLAETRAALACLSEENASKAAAPTRLRALWICDGSSDNQTGRFLLERAGFEVGVALLTDGGVTPADDQPDQTPPACIIIDCHARRVPAAHRLACDRAGRTNCRVILLKDARSGEPARGRDAATGLPYLPRLFTALDLEWAEKQT